MFYIKKLFTAIAIVFVVFVALEASNRYIGTEWTNAILLILILIAIAFQLPLSLHKKHEISVKIEKEDIDIDGVLAYALGVGYETEMDYIQKLKPESEQPTYAQLKPAQQVMKSEENAIRARIAETIRFRNSEAFKTWEVGKQQNLLKQLGAMVLYHWCLLARCEMEGVLLRVDSSEPSGSSSSSGSSSDSSSSDSSSSSDGSSPDSSDSSSSSSSSSSDNAKTKPGK